MKTNWELPVDRKVSPQKGGIGSAPSQNAYSATYWSCEFASVKALKYTAGRIHAYPLGEPAEVEREVLLLTVPEEQNPAAREFQICHDPPLLLFPSLNRGSPYDANHRSADPTNIR